MRRWFPLALFLLGVTVLSRGAASPPPAHPAPDRSEFKSDSHFATTLKTHFDHWDKDRRGQLSVQDVSRLVHDRSITDASAAAIAALHLYQVSHQDKSVVINKQVIDEVVKSQTAGKFDGLPRTVHDDYYTLLKHLRGAPKELFAEKGPIGLQGARQGQLGDCFLVSTIGAAVHRNPEAVKRWFHPDKDGSCELVFADGRKTRVPKLTDTEIALGSTCGAQGLWLPTLELAVAQFWGGDKVAEDTIAKGGKLQQVIPLFTGHQADYFTIKDKGAAGEKQVRGLLEAAFGKHQLVVAGTGRGGKAPPGMARDHDYAVLGFDGKAGTVHLWNPWGSDFEPKGRAGLENGYSTQGGKFSMPLKEFVEVFDSINHEVDAPAPKHK